RAAKREPCAPSLTGASLGFVLYMFSSVVQFKLSDRICASSPLDCHPGREGGGAECENRGSGSGWRSARGWRAARRRVSSRRWTGAIPMTGKTHGYPPSAQITSPSCHYELRVRD